MKKIYFEIITPDKVVFSSEIDQITLPTTDGVITILPDHAPLVAETKPGEIIIKTDGKTNHMAVMNGFVETSDSKVRLMTEAAELAENIDERRAEEARRRAEEAREKAKDSIEFTEASAAFERALTRIKIAKRKHSRHM
jgi:F-type H+-transporting ATPase subunit epsilon